MRNGQNGKQVDNITPPTIILLPFVTRDVFNNVKAGSKASTPRSRRRSQTPPSTACLHVFLPSCCFFLLFLDSIGSHCRQLGPIIVFLSLSILNTKADVLESRRPFYYIPKRSRRRSDSPSSRGMSLPSMSIIIIYTSYTKADVKESRRPNDPIQTYIPMNLKKISMNTDLQ
jgi:hypothetical protein